VNENEPMITLFRGFLTIWKINFSMAEAETWAEELIMSSKLFFRFTMLMKGDPQICKKILQKEIIHLGSSRDS